ncbi:hypothetical protein GJ496_001464 [Pomphorhynchus laevis]|nr:hypothetical protein GJ496_001464 [Pomphorhynchus laevis]
MLKQCRKSMDIKMIWFMVTIALVGYSNGMGINTETELTEALINSTLIDEQSIVIISFNKSGYETLNVSKDTLPEKIQQFLTDSDNVTIEEAVSAFKVYLADVAYAGLGNLTDNDFEEALERIRREHNDTDVQNNDAFSNLTNESISITEMKLFENTTNAILSEDSSASSTYDQLTSENIPFKQNPTEDASEAAVVSSTVNDTGDMLSSELKGVSSEEPTGTTSVEVTISALPSSEGINVFSTEEVNITLSVDNTTDKDTLESRCKQVNEILKSIISRWTYTEGRSYQAHSDKSNAYAQQTQYRQQQQPDEEQQQQFDNNVVNDEYYLPFEHPEVYNWQRLIQLRKNPALWSMFETDPGVLFVAAHWVRRTYFASNPEPLVDPLLVNKMILDRPLTTNIDEEVDVKTMMTQLEENKNIREMFLTAPDTLAYVLSSIASKYPELNITSSDEMLKCPAEGESIDEKTSAYAKQLYDPLPWYIKLKNLLRAEFKKQPQLWTYYYSRVLECVTKCTINYALDDSAEIGQNINLKDPISATIDSAMQPDFTDEQRMFIAEVMDKPIILKIIMDDWQFISTVLEEATKIEILQGVYRAPGLSNALLNYFTRYPYTLDKLLQNPMLVTYALYNSAENPIVTPNQIDSMQPPSQHVQNNFMNNYCPHHQVLCSQLPAYKQQQHYQQYQQQQQVEQDNTVLGNKLYYGTFSGPLRYYQIDQTRSSQQTDQHNLASLVDPKDDKEIGLTDLRHPVHLVKHSDNDAEEIQ